jgi:hypothetical protein
MDHHPLGKQYESIELVFEEEDLAEGRERGIGPRIVRQKDASGCGVACLAMATGMEYPAAREVFNRLGLDKTRHAGRKPYSSNFKELRAALSACGLPSELRRFSGWNAIAGPCIVKVNSGKLQNWHWVFASRTVQYGLHILNPALPLPYLEKMPLDVMCTGLEVYKPYGCYIEIQLANFETVD